VTRARPADTGTRLTMDWMYNDQIPSIMPLGVSRARTGKCRWEGLRPWLLARIGRCESTLSRTTDFWAADCVEGELCSVGDLGSVSKWAVSMKALRARQLDNSLGGATIWSQKWTTSQKGLHNLEGPISRSNSPRPRYIAAALQIRYHAT